MEPKVHRRAAFDYTFVLCGIRLMNLSLSQISSGYSDDPVVTCDKCLDELLERML